MVIYNYKKEFVGIEEQDLRALGLANLTELQSEAADFAELFVKRPGYIHNFKYVHWLDFIRSADPIDENRVVISVKGRSFEAAIELRSIFLIDEPQKEGYGVVLSNIQELASEEDKSFVDDFTQKDMMSIVEPTSTEALSFEKEDQEENEVGIQEIAKEPYMTKETIEDEQSLTLDVKSPSFNEEMDKEVNGKEKEASLDISLDVKKLVSTDEAVYTNDEDDRFKDYHYDPEFAAKELGLSKDLIEEFVYDFTIQANELKAGLYEALNEEQMDKLRELSQKLKEIAANLHIENAYDALVTINTSDDIKTIKRTLDYFYNVIIKNLADEAVSSKQKQPQEESITLDLDEEIIEVSSNEKNDQKALRVSQEDEKIELDLDFDEEETLELLKEDKKHTSKRE